MKFHINTITLWFRENLKRKTFQFEPNKVNVITGDSSTGKSSLLSIIDYCFLSEKTKIVEEVINENVDWYGIHFSLDEELYFIGRRYYSKGVPAEEICFIKTTDIPNMPIPNIKIEELRPILDKLFGITEQIKNPFDEENLNDVFLLSFRYFLLFNTISEDIIGTSSNYFDVDFFGREEYSKALDKVFPMIIGMDNIRRIRAKERKKEIQRELQKISRERNKFKEYETKVESLVRIALSYDLLDAQVLELSIDDIFRVLQSLVSNQQKEANNTKLYNEFEIYRKKRNNLKREIVAIDKLKKEYFLYIESIKKKEDSLAPIEYIKQNYSEIIDSYDTKVFIELLATTLSQIKKNYPSSLVPKERDFDARLDKLRLELKDIEGYLNKLPSKPKAHDNDAQRYMFIGELKNKLEAISLERKKIDVALCNNHTLLDNYDHELKRLDYISTDSDEEKILFLKNLDNCIQRNYDLTNSMGIYQNYKVHFNEKLKIIQLIKEGELFPIEATGSKSNHMFLHLCLFLGLHEHIIRTDNTHVPQFLFIDQPSIPYYSGSSMEISNDDTKKLKDAFNLLNSFLVFVNNQLGETFQIIMVEHAPKEYWSHLEYYHTVDEFINGNGLIPQYIRNKNE